jgi:anti-sigma factor RsiW
MNHSNHDYDCDQALPLLARHRDGELPEESAGRLRRHLMDCPDCRREASEHRNLSRWFEHGLPAGSPAGFAARVAALATQDGAVAGAFPSAAGGAFGSAAGSGSGSGSGGEASFELEPAASRGSGLFERLEQNLMLAVAAAAIALIGLAVALGWQQQPASEGLQAESLPLVLEELKALNETAERAANDESLDGDALEGDATRADAATDESDDR